MRIIETFVGCGGAHTGFRNAGFSSVFVNDVWDRALKVVQTNHGLLDHQIIHADIRIVDESLLREHGVWEEAQGVDVLFGGVVCKSFSGMGDMNPLDPRSNLYLEQLRLTELLHPKLCIIENVPNFLRAKVPIYNHKTSTFAQKLEHLYREKRALKSRVSAAAFATLTKEEQAEVKANLETNKAKLKKNIASAKAACTFISAHEDYVDRLENLGYHTFTRVIAANSVGCATVRKRCFVVGVRDDVWACKGEWKWPEESAAPPTTVQEAWKPLEQRDTTNEPESRKTQHSPQVVAKFKTIEEGTVGTAYAFRSHPWNRKLHRNLPAPTIVTKPFLHPVEHRQLTVRENALLMGFPVDYRFPVSADDGHAMIGNSIPVQLAQAIAEQAKAYLQ